MRRKVVIGRTRQYLAKLAKLDTKGANALGENIDDAIHEANEVLALVHDGFAETEDFHMLDDLNSAFDSYLKGE